MPSVLSLIWLHRSRYLYVYSVLTMGTQAQCQWMQAGPSHTRCKATWPWSAGSCSRQFCRACVFHVLWKWQNDTHSHNCGQSKTPKTQVRLYRIYSQVYRSGNTRIKSYKKETTPLKKIFVGLSSIPVSISTLSSTKQTHTHTQSLTSKEINSADMKCDRSWSNKQTNKTDSQKSKKIGWNDFKW